MLRRLVLIVTIVGLLFCLTPTREAPAAEGVRVLMDGIELSMDSPPRIVSGRTMVPFRAVAEAMGVDVQWDGLDRTVTARGANGTVVMQIDNNTATVGGVGYSLESPPAIFDGRTLIPLRFFGESLGAQVEWRPDTRSVYLASPPQAMAVIGYYALGDERTSSWVELFGQPYPDHTAGKTGLFSRTIMGWYGLDAKGALLTQTRSGFVRPQGWEDVLSTLDQYGITADMMVYMADGQHEATSLLENQQAVQRAVQEIVQEAHHYSGVNLDLEGLGMSQKGEELVQVRQSFNQFVSQLANELRIKGKGLTLSLHPLNSAYAGYDYAVLGSLADGIIIMAYDYGALGEPEPVNKVREAVEMALRHVAPDKIILGISAASENPASLPGKIGIAKAHNLQGIALWRLGLIGEESAQVLGRHVTKGSF